MEGLACDTNFFCFCIAFFLLTITPIFCCNYANYIARVQLLRVDPLPDVLESGKYTSLHRPDDLGISHNKQLIDN